MHTARFSRRARLLKAGEYQHVFDHAERSSDAYFTVLARSFSEVPGNGQARLGLAISRKKAKLAVARNRLKRIIRESFRSNRARLCNADFVVLAGPRCTGATNRQLFDSLENHWSKLNKKCASS